MEEGLDEHGAENGDEHREGEEGPGGEVGSQGLVGLGGAHEDRERDQDEEVDV